ncbi:MAG: tyrosine-type recombinase/integrase [Tepidiformaceae bacterium]
MLAHFFGRVGKTPDQVTSPEVLSWAHGIGLSGREPSSVTVGARTACLSSFYKFLIRMSIVTGNPCDALERPKIQPSPARGYTAGDVQKILAVIPDTVAGRRDRAIVLTLVMTGRRRSEVINLKAKDITVEDERAFYSYRGKGGKQGRRELPRPAYLAVLATLADAEKSLLTMEAFGVDLAGGSWRTRRHLRHVLQPSAHVHARGGPPAHRCPYPPPHGCQAASERGRVH